MTRSEFISLGDSLVRYEGTPYTTDATEKAKLVNDRLRSFTEKVKCLYDDRVAMTLTQNVAVYSLRDTNVFTKEMVTVDIVVVDGDPLYNYQGQIGLASLREVQHFDTLYLTADAAKPSKAFLRPPYHLVFNRKPDQAYANCYVSGFYLHPAIDTDSDGDDVELSVPEEYQRAACVWYAADLMLPTADAKSDYERLALLAKRAGVDMDMLRDASQDMLDGPSVRGLDRGNRSWVSLGG
jgi:hypothetical protein